MRLVIVRDPEEKEPPSPEASLLRFAEVARNKGVSVSFHNLKDGFPPDCDAIWIRQETHPNNKTFQLAKWAEYVGIPIIDDWSSIAACCNKIEMFRRFSAEGVPQPKSKVVHGPRSAHLFADEIGYPVVIKDHDSTFSRGVYKAENLEELKQLPGIASVRGAMLAQEFVRTSFDWRIGILKNVPIYCCQYEMVPGHWQIVKHTPNGVDEGDYKLFKPEDFPEKICQLAVKASYCVGDGLYGVDIKETPQGPVVIEINDNPSIEHDGEALYGQVFEKIIERFKEMVDGRKTWQQQNADSQISYMG